MKNGDVRFVKIIGCSRVKQTSQNVFLNLMMGAVKKSHTCGIADRVVYRMDNRKSCLLLKTGDLSDVDRDTFWGEVDQLWNLSLTTAEAAGLVTPN